MNRLGFAFDFFRAENLVGQSQAHCLGGGDQARLLFRVKDELDDVGKLGRHLFQTLMQMASD
jgi:hypothetical protein